jgi:hypothetical protein
VIEAKHLATLGAIAALVAGGVWLSAAVDSLLSDKRVTEASAAVIGEHAGAMMGDFKGNTPGNEKAFDQQIARLGFTTVCVSSEVPLDFALLERRLAQFRLRAARITDCTSDTGEACDGVPPGPRRWFDKRGAEAGMATIKDVQYSDDRRCVVELVMYAFGGKYAVDRTTKGWAVTGSSEGWVI